MPGAIYTHTFFSNRLSARLNFQNETGQSDE